jgi:hypothetical protein
MGFTTGLKIIIIIIIITITIRHQLGLNRPLSASSNSLFKGLPSRHPPFGLYFRIIFWHLVSFLFHVVANHENGLKIPCHLLGIDPERVWTQ